MAVMFAVGTSACTGDEGPAGEQGEQGPQGETGEQGPQGEPGEDGADGADGEDGLSSLVNTEDIEAGDECTHGGVRLNSGLDADADGTLAAEEVESSAVVCYSANADCAGAFEITDVTGTDQRLFEGVQSDPITVTTDSEGDVDVEFVNAYLNFESTGNAGEFTVTPPMLGGPFAVLVVAKNDCAIDTSTFTFDAVEPAVSTARALHLFEGAGTVDVAPTGTTDALFTLGFTMADGPLQVEPNTYAFDVIDDTDTVIATSPQVDLNLGDSNTIVAHPDTNGDPDFTVVANDIMDPAGDISVQATHLNPNVGTVAILNVAADDSSTVLFDNVAFGDSSAPATVSGDIDRIGIDVDDDDVADLLYLVDAKFGAGEIVSLFVYEGDRGPNVLVQYIDESSDTAELMLEPTVSVTNNTTATIDDTTPVIAKEVTVSGCPGTVTYMTVDIDITHAYAKDMAVDLTSPDDTTVRLQESAFQSGEDLIGTYPTTLTVEGPGALADFHGAAGDGVWTLDIEDTYPSFDDGTFNSFSVNLYCN